MYRWTELVDHGVCRLIKTIDTAKRIKKCIPATSEAWLQKSLVQQQISAVIFPFLSLAHPFVPPTHRVVSRIPKRSTLWPAFILILTFYNGHENIDCDTRRYLPSKPHHRWYFSCFSLPFPKHWMDHDSYHCPVKRIRNSVVCTLLSQRWKLSGRWSSSASYIEWSHRSEKQVKESEIGVLSIA